MAESWTTLASAVGNMARQAGCGDLGMVGAWIDLASSVGPTPAQGPLKLDLLPPTAWAPRRWGLNVFDDEVIEVARAWTATWLGGSAAAAVERLAGSGARWAGGLLWNGGELRLKLYAVDSFDDLAAPMPWARDEAIALGVDVTEAGEQRWRAYLPAREGLVQASEAQPWLVGHPGVEHRLVTVSAEAGAKRSQNWIFGPRARLHDLSSLARRLGLPEVVGWCDGSAPLVLTGGLRLAPVALEWDMHPGGRSEPDLLYTLAEPA